MTGLELGGPLNHNSIMERRKNKFFTAFGRGARGWILAVIVTGIAATITSAQFVVAALADIGAVVPLGQRLALTGNDLIGLMPLYLIFIAFGFLIAFLIAALLLRFVPLPRAAVNIVAGMTAMGVMLWAMEQVFFGVPIIAGARTAAGFTGQVLCGGLGGYVFARMSRARAIHAPNDNFEILPT